MKGGSQAISSWLALWDLLEDHSLDMILVSLVSFPFVFSKFLGSGFPFLHAFMAFSCQKI